MHRKDYQLFADFFNRMLVEVKENGTFNEAIAVGNLVGEFTLLLDNNYDNFDIEKFLQAVGKNNVRS
jgi:hypothetical protein